MIQYQFQIIFEDMRKSYKLPQGENYPIHRFMENNDFCCFYFSIESLKAKEKYHQITDQNYFKAKILYLVKLSCRDEGKDKFRQVVKTTEILNHNKKLNKNKRKYEIYVMGSRDAKRDFRIIMKQEIYIIIVLYK